MLLSPGKMKGTPCQPCAPAYEEKAQGSWMEQIHRICREHRLFLLGVTGGVASGKTTVARMLEERGAPAIDFDLLSRVVVEVGKPAWREIVAAFGPEFLLADRRLDRERLRAVVFQDPAKRKLLERILHPPIFQEFVRVLGEHAGRRPGSIIQAVVPLLLEGGLRPLVHKVLVVYAPPEIQIKRLVKRDGISREMARRILEAQMPMEGKKGQADFVIDNSGPLQDTCRQTDKVWRELKALQEERSGGRSG